MRVNVDRWGVGSRPSAFRGEAAAATRAEGESESESKPAGVQLCMDGGKDAELRKHRGWAGLGWAGQQLTVVGGWGEQVSTFPTNWCVTRDEYRRRGMDVIHAMAMDKSGMGGREGQVAGPAGRYRLEIVPRCLRMGGE